MPALLRITTTASAGSAGLPTRCSGRKLAGRSLSGAERFPSRRAASVSLKDESDLKLALGVNSAKTAAADASDLSAFVQRSIADSFDAARQFAETSSNQPSAGRFPSSPLGEKLRLVSRLLKLGGGTPIYYALQPGYDTHAAQLYTPSPLLDEFSEALAAFLADLQTAK